MSEWLTGFVFKEKQMLGQIQNLSGGVEHVELTELGVRGVPTDKRARKRVSLNLDKLVRIDPQEYLAGFRLEGICGKNGQSCFEALVEGIRLLIPALAMLRALVRPNKLLLARALTAPGIASAVTLATDKKELLFFQLPLGGMERLAPSVQSQLRWLLSSPSAQKMQGTLSKSVAMDGRLDCIMPVGELSCIVRGVKSGKTMYVTDLTPLALENGDGHESGRLILHASLDAHGRGEVLADCHGWRLPARKDGGWSLTDDEWRHVMKIMQNRINIYERTLNRREMLDALLEKLSSKDTWRNVSRGRFSAAALPVLFRTLIACGAWGEVMKFLMSSRDRLDTLKVHQGA